MLTEEVRPGILLIRPTRPGRPDSMNTELVQRLRDALAEVRDDAGIRAIVLTGNGRAFCAGLDLNGHGEPLGTRGVEGAPQAGLRPQKHIAVVNGFALGGGTEIVLACDLAVIDETASLGLLEVRRGLLTAAGGVIRLQRQVPFKIAAEIALTGESINAERALELGLVNRVAEGDLARRGAPAGGDHRRERPLSARETRRVMHESVAAGSDWDKGPWKVGNEAMKKVFASEDTKEGARAFAEKRTPVWTGK